MTEQSLVPLAESLANLSAPLRGTASQPRPSSVPWGSTPNPGPASRAPGAARRPYNHRRNFWRAAPVSLLPQTMNVQMPVGLLRRDTRGAILLVGIVLGVALASAVLHLVNIGSGILWREAAQNAADAGAFENAVWHARGMNMIAALNILLSLLSAVIVLWRLAMLALAFATLIQLVGSMQQPDAAPEAAQLPLSPLVEMLSADDRVAETISSVARGLSAAQTAVATYTPVLATQVRSPELNTRDAMSVATFSASLLPNVASTADAGDEMNHLTRGRGTGGTSATRRERAPAAASSRLGMPFSLPVVADSHSLLCPRLPEGFQRRSTVLVPWPATVYRSRLLNVSAPREERALGALGIDADGLDLLPLVESLAGLTTTDAPALFCAHSGRPIERLKQEMWKIAERASERTAGNDASLSTAIRAHLQHSRTSLTSVPEARALFGRWQLAFQLDASEFRFGRPAKVWSPAENGNVYLRSTAVVSKKTGSRVSMPSPFATTSQTSPVGIWAHAEMYFDCAKTWNECGPNAMWQLAWSARLRRIQPFALLLQRADTNPNHVDPRSLESTIVDWLQRSALQIGRNVAPPQLQGFVPAFDVVRIRNTRTFELLDASNTGPDTDNSMFEFLEHQAAASSVIH